MKETAKRVFSVFIILAMLAAATVVFSGCDNTGSAPGGINDSKAVTITITSIRGKNTTDDAIALVQNALNAITEQEYNIHVVLQLFAADEFEQKVYSISDDLEKRYREVSTERDEKGHLKYREESEIFSKVYEANTVVIDGDVTGGKKANGDTVVYDRYGIMSTVFPTLAGEQLDIVLISGLDMFNNMLSYSETKMQYLSQLDNLISENATLIGKYVNSSAKTRLSKINAGLYALPNNRVWGNYEYMLIDREIFNKYNYDVDTVTQVSDVEQFLYDVAANETDVTPLYNYNGLQWLTFYDFDSILVKNCQTQYNTELSQYPTSILGYSLFKKTNTMLSVLRNTYHKEYKETEVVDFDANWAVALMPGNSTVPETYKDKYYVVKLQNPYLTNELYESMFGVSRFAQYPDRCAQVLGLLTTNPTFVNTLAYGIEGTHYDLDKDGRVTNRDSSWDYDIKFAGNGFLLKQNTDMTPEELAYSADEWKLGKLQNKDIVVDLYCGFQLKYDTEADHLDEKGKPLTDTDGTVIQYMLVEDTVKGLKELSEDIFARIESFDGSYVDESGVTVYCDFEEYCKVLSRIVQANDAFKAATLASPYKKNTSWSPQGQYTSFFTSVY